jgi:hypothetical protein
MIEITSRAEAPYWLPNSDKYGRSALAIARSVRAGGIGIGSGSGSSSAVAHSNGFSVMVTSNHDMYIKHGLVDSTGTIIWDGQTVTADNKRRLVEFAYRKVPAKQLVVPGVRDAVSMLAHARSGFRASDDQRVLQMLQTMGINVNEPKAVNLFFQLLGFWLGDGSLQFTPDGRRYSVKFAVKKAHDAEWLESAFQTLDLDPAYWESGPLEGRVGEYLKVYEVKDKGWIEVFFDEYEAKYDARFSSRAPGAMSASAAAAVHRAERSEQLSASASSTAAAGAQSRMSWLRPDQHVVAVTQQQEGYMRKRADREESALTPPVLASSVSTEPARTLIAELVGKAAMEKFTQDLRGKLSGY